jgi:dTDP-3-amino-3,4,6-trideoxy-alpha-D-glucose transaminase
MILLNDFRRQWDDTKNAVLQAVAAVGESGWYILGEQVRGFEKSLAECWGVSHAVGVGSGLDAIEIALKVLGCRPGDRVLTTPLSAFATTLAVVKTGAVPVFVDTDEHGLIDLEQCERVMQREPVRFLLPVHLYGHALNLPRLSSLRDRFGCAIVEDCAQSIQASFEGIRTGTVGELAATSFYPTKNLGAMGDAGAVLTNREEHVGRIRALRDYGQSGKYRHDCIGYNSRMDEFHAAILRAFLPKLAAWTSRRREIAKRYLQAIRNPGIRLMDAPAGSDSVWHLFPVLLEPARKTAFLRHMAAHGVTTGEHYPVLIPEQPALRDVPYRIAEPCERARAIASSEVSLPIHPFLGEDEVEQVIAACNGWEAGRACSL